MYERTHAPTYGESRNDKTKVTNASELDNGEMRTAIVIREVFTDDQRAIIVVASRGVKTLESVVE